MVRGVSVYSKITYLYLFTHIDVVWADVDLARVPVGGLVDSHPRLAPLQLVVQPDGQDLKWGKSIYLISNICIVVSIFSVVKHCLHDLNCDHINCYKKVVVFQRQICIILTSMDF